MPGENTVKHIGLWRAGRKSARTLTALSVIGLLLVATGCGGILIGLYGALWTTTSCDRAGACGPSGHLLGSGRYGVYEFSDEWGSSILIGFSLGDNEPRGIAFDDTDAGLVLYVVAGNDIRVYDGTQEEDWLATIPVDSCESMTDVVVLEDGQLVVTCTDNDRLVKLDPVTATEVEAFSCCEGLVVPLAPKALAVSANGVLFTGSKRIERFDSESGTWLGTAVAEGVAGASEYQGLAFGPSGNLYVSGAGAGVLELSAETFELVRVLVPASGDLMPDPGALAFGDGGELYVASAVGTLLIEVDAETGEFARELSEASGPEFWTADLVVRP